MAKNVHIVFGLSCKFLLEHSFSIAPHLAGEVFCLGNDLRIGPITALDSPEGILDRENWFQSIDDEMVSLNIKEEGASDNSTITAINRLLSKGQVIHIWFGSNSYDLLSISRLIHIIQGFAKQLILVPVSESVQVSMVKQEFVPRSLAELRIEQVPSLERYFRSLTVQDLETMRGIWSNAVSRKESLRIVDVNNLFQDNVADKINEVLMSYCKKEYQGSALVIAYTLIATDFEISDITLNWMLKTLVKNGKLESRGRLRAMREYEVRLVKGHP